MAATCSTTCACSTGAGGPPLTTFLLVFGFMTVFTFTATPIYDATVQILIENENPNVVKFEEVYDQNKTTNDYYPTQYRILQSRVARAPDD